jgi:spore germination cell wall hydrolase CwlJ-like protein
MGFEGAKQKIREFIDDESGAGKAPTTEDAKKALRAGVLGAGVVAGLASMRGTHEAPAPVAVEEQERHQLDHMVEDIANSPMQSFGREYFKDEELTCLSDNVYHEARGEGPRGQYAVMFATLERVLHKKYPKSICGVVHQPQQFSWTSDNNILAQPINPRDYLKIAINVHSLMQGRDVASAAVEAGLEAGLPHGAMYYKLVNFTGSKKVETFFSHLQRVATIGNHDFYIQKEAAKTARVKTAPSPAVQRPRRIGQAGKNLAG